MNLPEDKKKITERYFEAINISNVELFGRIKNNYDKIKPIYPLIEFIIDRLSIVTDLTIKNNLWDAEIVYRSALETFIKLIFITSAEEQEQQIRIHEFWNELSEVNSLKQSEQGKKNLAHFGHIELMKLSYSPLVLNDEDEKKLRAKWNKTKRQKLEQKWSFSEMISSLMKNYKGAQAGMFVGLAHCYRMASHVSHGDETGILIIRERNSRSEEQQDIANFAHYIRLMSDSFSYCAWTAVETMHFIKDDYKFFLDLHSGLNDVHELTNKYQMKLYDEPDYDKYRTKEDL